MDKSTGTENPGKNLRRWGTNAALRKDPIILQEKSHFITGYPRSSFLSTSPVFGKLIDTRIFWQLGEKSSFTSSMSSWRA